MFRFTSKKFENDKLKQLYSQHNVFVPEKQLYGEDYLRQCFDSGDKSQVPQRPISNTTKANTKKFDIIRAQSSEKSQRPNTTKLNNQISNNRILNNESGIFQQQDQKHNLKQPKSSGTFIFPNKNKQQSYYIIPSSKAGLMDTFEKYKDYTPKDQTSFKNTTQRATPQKPIRHFKALSQHLSQTIHSSEKKPLHYYDQELPVDLFGNSKLNQSTSFHNKHTTNKLDNSLLFQNIKSNNSFTLVTPQQQTMNKSFLAEKHLNQNITQLQPQQSDNIFAATAYNNQNNTQTKYKQTHVSCFRGQSREKLTSQSFFVSNTNNPGPGEYENKSQFLLRKKKIQLQRNDTNDADISSVSINKLKKRIQRAVQQQDITIPQKQEDNSEKVQYVSLKQNNPSHMFITDQRDRFGENQYINFFSNKNPMYCPGPGQYQQSHKTILSQQQKIQKIKDQRKLLREWLNPKGQLQVQQQQQQSDTGEPIAQNNIDQQYTTEPLCVYQFSYN